MTQYHKCKHHEGEYLNINGANYLGDKIPSPNPTAVFTKNQPAMDTNGGEVREQRINHVSRSDCYVD